MQINSGIIQIMTTQEILNILLGFGFLVITACVVFITYFLFKVLRSIVNLTQSLEETSENIKGKLSNKMFAFLPALLIAFLSRIFKKRG